MNKFDFLQSLESGTIPEELENIHLQSLWFDAKGDWEKSHTLIQDFEDPIATRIHAYLHRKEGDLWNSDYWYGRIGMKRPDLSLKEEWQELVDSLF